jgi:diaminopimelate decarboxylase
MGLHSGCDPEKIMYTENNISDSEMHEAAKLGVLINFNSLTRLKKFGQSYPNSKVCLRFNPNVGAGSHDTNITGGPNCKFGISYKMIPEIKEILAIYNLNLVGIHQHIGSGWLTEKEPLIALDVILDIANQFENLEFIDFGGGFGVPYSPEEKPLDLNNLGKKFNQKMQQFNRDKSNQVKLIFEPGRFPIAESGQLITQVTAVKRMPHEKTFIGTDTGMNHLMRPALYDSYHPIENLSNPEGELETYDVVGNICECADVFAKDRELPHVSENDYLSIQIAGAYGTSMSNLYHLRSIPTELLYTKDGKIKVIRKSQTFEELLLPYS